MKSSESRGYIASPRRIAYYHCTHSLSLTSPSFLLLLLRFTRAVEVQVEESAERKRAAAAGILPRIFSSGCLCPFSSFPSTCPSVPSSVPIPFLKDWKVFKRRTGIDAIDTYTHTHTNSFWAWAFQLVLLYWTTDKVSERKSCRFRFLVLFLFVFKSFDCRSFSLPRRRLWS